MVPRLKIPITELLESKLCVVLRKKAGASWAVRSVLPRRRRRRVGYWPLRRRRTAQRHAAALRSLVKALQHHIEGGNEHDCEARRGDHAAEDRDADRSARCGAGAGRDDEREDAQNEGEGSHDNGPEPEPRRLNRGVEDLPPGGSLLSRIFDDEDRILAGERDQKDEADLCV
jgi:hypothetical protein